VKESRTVIEQAFPSADSLAIVLIGDAARIREQVKGYGPVTEVALTRPAFDTASRP